MSAPFLQRIVIKNSTVYEVSKPWPGVEPKNPPDPNQLTVGPIFFRKEFAESYPVLDDAGNIKRDRNQQALRETAIETEGAHYEIWCVPHVLFVNFFGQIASRALGGTFQVDQQQLAAAMQSGTVTRRRVFLDSVAHADDLWATEDAFEEIMRAFAELGVGRGGEEDEEDDEEDDEPEVEAPALEAGNGTQVLPPPSPPSPES